MNTLFCYQYRDGENYKNFADVIIEGHFALDKIENFLHESQFFIPSEVGLDDLQEMPFKAYDHIWHEIISISFTPQLPTCKIKAREFISNFKKANLNDWNQYEVFKRKGLI
ncbi:MAG: hypothetical protein A2020_04645 [Lentisphaerae bacterium GWF2_45_14]|nr:MAG: hypothetical protein A2020_04645 [Lentisphaerae bacterium GWF2_45_14]